MVEFFVILCSILILACVISKSNIAGRIDELQKELGMIMAEEQKASGQRRQIEGVLASLEVRERELQGNLQGVTTELAEIQAQSQEVEDLSQKRTKGQEGI